MRRRSKPRWSKRGGGGTRLRKMQRRRRDAQLRREALEERGIDEEDEDPAWELAARYDEGSPPRPGFLEMIFGLFKKKNRERPAEQALPPPGEDPVRRILAVPRGAARLDAFERSLDDLMPGTHGHRGVALAFHRELTSLAKKAAVDLSLLKSRVEKCADALLSAGEVEHAGMLLSRIGKKQRAAELFVAAGAIDELEEAHAKLEEEEGGERLSARLSYERFEGLFVVGLRVQALEALEQAQRHWPDNPVYEEIVDSFASRLQREHTTLLVEGGGKSRRVHVTRRFPLVVGRKEDAALRVASPLVSREHVEVVSSGGGLVLRNLQGPESTTVDGAPVERSSDLGSSGHFELSGVRIGYDTGEGWVRLAAEQQPDTSTVAMLEDRVAIPLSDDVSLELSYDAEGRLFAEPGGALVTEEGPLKRPLLLLDGDRLVGGSLRVKITHS
jgi:hypothetical protein